MNRFININNDKPVLSYIALSSDYQTNMKCILNFCKAILIILKRKQNADLLARLFTHKTGKSQEAKVQM